MIPTVLSGITCVSFFPTALSYGAELTFPLAPALVNAAMNFLGQVTAFILGGASSLMTDVSANEDLSDPESISRRQSNSISAITLFGVCTLFTLIITFFIREELRRINYVNDDELDNYVNPDR